MLWEFVFCHHLLASTGSEWAFKLLILVTTATKMLDKLVIRVAFILTLVVKLKATHDISQNSTCFLSLKNPWLAFLTKTSWFPGLFLWFLLFFTVIFIFWPIWVFNLFFTFFFFSSVFLVSILTLTFFFSTSCLLGLWGCRLMCLDPFNAELTIQSFAGCTLLNRSSWNVLAPKTREILFEVQFLSIWCD